MELETILEEDEPDPAPASIPLETILEEDEPDPASSPAPKAEILSRFLDISFRSKRNPPTESAQVISPTAPASTASITATGAPLQTELEPMGYSDSMTLVETQMA